MHLLIPYLDPRQGLLQAVLPDMPDAHLGRLAGRGRQSRGDACGWHTGLLARLGLPASTGLAEVSRRADGLPEGRHWLRADPVHLQLARDRAVLFDARHLALGDTERVALHAALTAHFGDEPAFHFPSPSRGYLALADAPDIHTTPPAQTASDTFSRCLPQGPQARYWRGIHNEIQMCLHEHPLNQAREARGALSVNALWLWGEGELARPAAQTARFFADDFDARILAQAAGWHVAPLPQSATGLPDDALVLLDTLAQATQAQDPGDLHQALQVLDNAWFSPLLAQRRAVSLEDPVSGWRLDLQRADYWKFWRRPARWPRTLAPGLPSMPAGDGGVDPFGNRY
jgi:hypothetical protein